MGNTLRVATVALVVGGLTAATIAPTMAVEPIESETPTASTAPEVPTPAEPVESATPTASESTAPPAAPVRVAAKKQPRTARYVTVEDVLAKRRSLQVGDVGPAATTVQRRLNVLGILVRINGRYTEDTAKGVARYQEKFNGFEYGEVTTINRRGYLRLIKLTARGDRVPRACKTATRAICVSKSQRIIRLYVRGKQVMGLDARFGRPGEETRNGTWRIFRKVKNDWSTQYRSPMPYSAYFSGGQALHFSKYFRADGYWGASHGCINIRDFDGAVKFWNSIPLGTLTIIYN